MRSIIILFSLIILMSSCGKPSYKKNEILKPQTEEATKSIVNDSVVNQKLNTEQQIASALLAAPVEVRDKAMVYGYGESGEFMVLREGSNEFVCIADDPEKDGFQVVGYHISLEPMMAKGRTLNAEGKSREEKEAIREEEAKSGKMSLPETPATLHIYHGKNGFYNTDSGLIENAKYRYVVYIPYATQESTGLSLAPNASSHPWLMFPGKYNAHIMITPEN